MFNTKTQHANQINITHKHDDKIELHIFAANEEQKKKQQHTRNDHRVSKA